MNIILVIVSAIIIGITIVTTRSYKNQKTIVSPQPTVTPTPTPTPIPLPTLPPIKNPTKNNPSGATINDLNYPNAIVKETGDGSITLTSGDSPDTITNWYKQKIASFGFPAKSFVTTNTNSAVLNKLVSANSQTEIRVTITKGSLDQTTQIVVSVISK